MKDELLFALDIGTRTVVGLLCRGTDAGGLRVEAHHVLAHPQRSMLDGQIHDVAQVSTVIREVREKLEQISGHKLDKASIAAAGRALSTMRTSTELEFSVPREVTEEDVRHLEMKALGLSKQRVGDKTKNLYCVGYSTVSYTLNDQVIANPVGQKGIAIGVELIATFLPQVVVDSLFGALAKAGLAVGSLTLEPIAAMAVAIPPRLRMLNLALVDIGAGTSDIAISREGTILAYAMVDKAGDEVTEALAQHYLLDFNAAEQLKLNLQAGRPLEFKDVLGNNYQESIDSIYKVVRPVVDELASAIARTIREHNGGISPAAVFCVGGGSQTPLLPEILAGYLELPVERVGIRRREALDNIVFDSPNFTGPEVVTPLGIALTALQPQGEHFIQVWVNDDSVTLFNVQQSIVAQALLHSGMDVGELLGVRGRSLEFTLNGVPKKIAGEPGLPGTITVNSQPGTLENSIGPGDLIQVAPGSRGADASCRLDQLNIDHSTLTVQIDGSPITFRTMQLVNGVPAEASYQVGQGDKVEIRLPETLAELAAVMDLELKTHNIFVDGVPGSGQTPVKSGQVLDFKPRPVGESESAQESERAQPQKVSSNAAEHEFVVTVNGQNHNLPSGQRQLMHALAQAEIDYSATKGRLVISVNGSEAEFTTELNPGDRVEVFWTA